MKNDTKAAEPFSTPLESQLFLDVMNGLSDPVLIVNAECAVLYANSAYFNTFSAVGHISPLCSFAELLPEKGAAVFKRRLFSLASSGEQGFFTSSRIKRFNGKWDTYEIRVQKHAGIADSAVFALHLRSIVDLIEARQEKTEKELRYHALAEHAADAFFVHDFNGRFVEVNQQACRSLGYSREELLCMSVTDVEQDFDLESAQAQWAHIEPDADFTLYGRQKRKDGTIFPVEIHFGCTMWQGEKLFLGMVRDITERLQAEEKFKRMVEGAPDPIFIQTNHCFAYINPAACRLFGIEKPQELLGTKILDRIHPDYREMAGQRIQKLNSQQIPVNNLYEQRFLRMDGSEVWVETKGEPIAYEGKRGALVFVRNITERKVAEQQLWESTERFRVAFECSATGICLLDVRGYFLSVNQALCDMFKSGKAYLIGKHFNDVTHPEDCDRCQNAVVDMLKDGSQSYTLEKRYLRSDGQPFWVSVSTAVVKDDGGKPIYLISQIQDITKRREMEQELVAKEAFSRAVMDNLPIGIAVNSVSPNVSFSYMNDRFPQYYRTTKEALMQPDAFWDAVYEDPVFRQEMQARVLGDIQSGDPARLKWENIPISRKGQDDRYISAYNTHAPDSMLEISTVMDVTGHILSERALRKNTLRLEALHQIDQAILMGTDTPGEIAAKALAHLQSLLHTRQASITMLSPDGKQARYLARTENGTPEIMLEDEPAIKAFGNLEHLLKGKMDIAEDAWQISMSAYAADILKEEGVC